jgi:antitoxin CptB
MVRHAATHLEQRTNLLDRSVPQDNDDDMAARRRRALYRATHRGTREMDYLLTRFAEAEVSALSVAELALFERVMALPEPVLMAAIVDDVGEFEPPIGEFIARIRGFHRQKR